MIRRRTTDTSGWILFHSTIPTQNSFVKRISLGTTRPFLAHSFREPMRNIYGSATFVTLLSLPTPIINALAFEPLTNRSPHHTVKVFGKNNANHKSRAFGDWGVRPTMEELELFLPLHILLTT
ncbi:hypothetical protein CPB86DRAFT_401476 [Serendipita vermifera]|nr:hypothetical protein CPB86DRAFT_401476 [Serendipita vermifera]